MADPKPLLFPATGFWITNVTVANGSATLSWQRGIPPFQVWGATTPTGPWRKIGNNVLPKYKMFPVEQNQFWRVQCTITNTLTANPTNQPRLTWTAPDTDMSDPLQNFTAQISTDGGANWANIADNADGQGAGVYLAATRSAVDATSGATLKYRLLQTTTHGVVIPYDMPSLSVTQQPSGGTVLLAKPLPGTSFAFPQASCTDNSGHLFVAGVFAGDVNFGGTTLTAGSAQDAFLARYNTTTGALDWVVQKGGSLTYDKPTGIKIDASGNIFIAAAWPDGLVHKYTSTGSPIWNKGGVADPTASQSLFVLDLALDSAGNAVVVGDISTPKAIYADPNTHINFGDGYTLHSAGGVASQSAYWAKYSPSGTCLYALAASSLGGTSHATGVSVDKRINPLTFLPYDEVIIGGWLDSTMNWAAPDFPSDQMLRSAQTPFSAGSFTYLARFNSANVYMWSKVVGDKPSGYTGSVFNRTTRLALDSAGRIILIGTWNYAVNLGGGIRTGTSYTQGFFAAGYNSAGAWIWDFTERSDKQFDAFALALDAQDNPIVGLHFVKSYNLGPFPLLWNMLSGPFIGNSLAAKFTGTTGTLSWVTYWGHDQPTQETLVNSVAVDSGGFIWASGSFGSAITVGTNSISAPSSTRDVILIKLSP